ncbi:MAG: hypothetical protein SYC29_09380 [Planctomycetota bacterium]|nr:hypothetical protein [Planctomycetota bacterium]
MPQCNIDARGRALRLIAGLAALVAGLVLGALVLGGVLESAWWWVLIVLLLPGGGFGVYEGRAGWCAVRAMGFRTPI